MANVRWKFLELETGEEYVFLINPNEAEGIRFPRDYAFSQHDATRQRGLRTPTQPKAWNFSGVLRTQSQHDAMLEWAQRSGKVRITDHLNRQMEVMVTGVDMTDRRSVGDNQWRFTYSFHTLLLRTGSVANPLPPPPAVVVAAPPTANFTSSASGLSVTFDGTGSADADGTIVSYAWTFGDGTTGTGSAPVHTFPGTATYSVTLIVTDSDGLTGSVTKAVSVVAPVVPNQPPVANFVFATSGLSVFLNGLGSSDSDGTIVSYAWNFGDGNTDTTTGGNPLHTYAAAGTYSVVLTVTDDDGATHSITKSVIVTEPVDPPEPPGPTTPVTASLPIGSTSYAIPSPVPSTWRFVNQATGSDSNAGTQASPWKTWAKANASAPSGSTVVMKNGNYHEKFVVSSAKSFVVQAAPGETVWFDGSFVVSGWTSNSNGTWSAPYALDFPRTAAPYSAWDNTNPQGKFRHYGDQLWRDGVAMIQVEDGSVPAAGQFSVNQVANTITVGSDPTGKVMRASDLTEANVSGKVEVYGIGFRRFTGKNINNSGTDGWSCLYVAGNSYNSVFENCVFSDMPYVALSSIRPITLRKLTVENIGMTPIFMEKGGGSVVDGVSFSNYNLGRWNAEPVVAAIKVARTDGIEIRNCKIRNGSGAYGIWLDVNCDDYKIVNNDIDGYSVIGNDMERGIEVEISGGGLFGSVQKKGIIANNRVTNCEVLLMAFNSDNNHIYNNDLRGGDVCLMLWQDTRASRDNYRTATEVPWLTRQNYVHNNMFELGGQTTAYAAMIECENKVSGNPAGSTVFPNLVSGNWFHSAGNVASMNNNGSTSRSSYATLVALAAVVGSKLGANVESSTQPADSTAIALPADIAAAIGVSTGVQKLGPILPAPVVQT